MIEYKVGNLLDAHEKEEIPVIAHQANCFCLMGSGIAKEIAKRVPVASTVDMNTIKGDARKLGTFTMGLTGHGAIFNLYGQYNPGKNTDYKYLRGALRSMGVFLQGAQACFPFAGDKVIGLPKIGAGIGGGDWTMIEAIIEEELGTHFDVVVYVLNERELPDGIRSDKL